MSVQFCGNDPNVMLEAALLAQDHCDAIDINLGCPQAIAKRGKYGSYLQDDWPLLQSIGIQSRSINLHFISRISTNLVGEVYLTYHTLDC